MTSDGLLRLASVTLEQLQRNFQLVEESSRRRHSPPLTCTWFVPLIDNPLRGGVRTIFMFAQHLSKRYGTVNRFVFCTLSQRADSLGTLSESIRHFFPDMRFVTTLHRHFIDSIDVLGWSDVSICTLWTTAYEQIKYNRTGRKFYLVQDYEPLFYEAGSIYGAIEQTYRFGFQIIANSPGVACAVARYSDKPVIEFTPGVDVNLFRPKEASNELKFPLKVIFYGRPSNPRNSFALGLEIFRALKNKMKDDVEIYSVGAEWSETQYGVERIVRNLGVLRSMEEVAELYRSSHIGLAFMMTPHPSYQPLEYMASGCVAAANINEANRWLLTEENSLQLEPIPQVAAERIYNLACDPARWSDLRAKGLETVRRLSWDEAVNTFDRALAP